MPPWVKDLNGKLVNASRNACLDQNADGTMNVEYTRRNGYYLLCSHISVMPVSGYMTSCCPAADGNEKVRSRGKRRDFWYAAVSISVDHSAGLMVSLSAALPATLLQEVAVVGYLLLDCSGKGLHRARDPGKVDGFR